MVQLIYVFTAHSHRAIASDLVHFTQSKYKSDGQQKFLNNIPTVDEVVCHKVL